MATETHQKKSRTMRVFFFSNFIDFPIMIIYIILISVARINPKSYPSCSLEYLPKRIAHSP